MFKNTTIWAGLLIALLATFGTSEALAQDAYLNLADASPLQESTPSLSNHSDLSQTLQPEGYLWIFGGLDAGTMAVSTTAAGEANSSGYQIRPKLLASYYFDQNWALDGGFGWSRFSVDTDSKSTTVATRAGFFELSPKWRASDRWQIGPVADLYYGTDLSLAQSYQGAGLAFFGGAQAQFDLPVASEWRMRIGASLLTSVGASDRQAFSAMGGLQIGLPAAKLK